MGLRRCNERELYQRHDPPPIWHIAGVHGEEKKPHMTISSRFDRFLTHIRPSRQQLEAADQQVAFLREQLTERVRADKHFHLEKIFRAGSVAKHTDLARAGKNTFDIDLGVYYRAQGQTEEQLSKLLPYTHARLREIYSDGKPARDFHVGKNAVNVTFRTSGLQVDVVPIIRDGSLKRRNSGWIPRQDEQRLTSITAHIHFVHSRTARSKQVPGPVKFNHMVRLMKWWNRQLPESLRQCSYFCELITAAALEERGVTNEWQSSLCQIFTFLSQHAFSRPIVFNDNYDAKTVKYPNDPVIVLDAVNPDNNVTSKWTKEIKQGYLKSLRKTRGLIIQAQDDERAGHEEAALDTWCQIFGDDFRR
jgi:hypothetical protein